MLRLSVLLGGMPRQFVRVKVKFITHESFYWYTKEICDC
jgi:hypothetical protein